MEMKENEENWEKDEKTNIYKPIDIYVKSGEIYSAKLCL